jgi:hypothetical protein
VSTSSGPPHHPRHVHLIPCMQCGLHSPCGEFGHWMSHACHLHLNNLALVMRGLLFWRLGYIEDQSSGPLRPFAWPDLHHINYLAIDLSSLPGNMIYTPCHPCLTSLPQFHTRRFASMASSHCLLILGFKAACCLPHRPLHLLIYQIR